MVFKKPYAFFIKHFRLFHLILSALVIYSIVRITGVVGFINSYIENNGTLIEMDDVAKIYNSVDFIVPLVSLGMSILLLIIMTMKNKPNKFYAYSTLVSAVLFAFNIYGRSVFVELTTVWLDVGKLNTLSDLYVFLMIALIVQVSMAVSRTVGFNISRFDFNNDILKLELDESDNAEVEFVVDFDVNDLKRGIQKRSRYVKYFLKEYRNTLIWTLGIFLFFVASYCGFSYLKNRKNVVSLSEFNTSINGFAIEYNGSYIINTDPSGNALSNNKVLLVLDLTIKNTNRQNAAKFIPGTIGIEIGDEGYVSTNIYALKVQDLGVQYEDESIKPQKSIRKIFVYEIPKNRIKSKIYFSLLNVSTKKEIYAKIKPTEYLISENEEIDVIDKNKEITFDKGIFENSKLKIDSIEIAPYYQMTYEFCPTRNKKDCYSSKEVLRPSVYSSNDALAVMQIKGKFETSNKKINNLYLLLNNYGYIEYRIGDNVYQQKFKYNRLESSKVKEEDTYYVEVLDEIRTKAESISIIINLRGVNYRYNYTKEEVKVNG